MLPKDCSDYTDDITREEVAKFLYDKVVAEIVEVLEKQKGIQHTNALIDLGDQVACGISIYWSSYVETVRTLTLSYLENLPEKFKWAMWQNASEIDNYVDEDEDDLDNVFREDDIAQEVFQRVCYIAEDAYDDYVVEEDDK